jgi:tyrosyl-tRNA synthetase
MTTNEQVRALSRGCAEIISPEDLGAKLDKSARSGVPLRVKLGVDPTVPHVTLGWAVILRKLRDFQKLGHTACLIIGDFTAMIGDPSGKSKTRPQLSREQVAANVEAVASQLFRILDKEKTEILFNADWLGKMSFADVIGLASHMTVARILERDDFQKRLAAERPIGMHEILYPLCQGYDSVAMRADIELGGNDQKFNNLVGRTLQGQMGQDAQVVMLMPLLVGLDGKEKMSQSLGNFISIVDEPYEMFGKTMSIPDSLMDSWFTLCTDVPLEEVASLITGNPRDAKLRLAKEIVAIYHGASAGDEAEDYFVRTFSKREEPVDAPTAQIPPELLADGSAPIAPLIHALGLTASIGEARRIIKGGGVSIGAQKVSEPFAALPVGELEGKVLRVGKHKFRTLKA